MKSKRTKVSRQRGSHTHGWGAKKKHRGAGHRGGRGNAGSGKKGDAKKPSFWKNKKYFGKHGFIKKGVSRPVKGINVGYLEEHLKRLIAQELVKEEKGVYTVDVSKLGFNKVLGNGTITKRFKITASYASPKAVEKIKKAGGEIITKEG